MEIKNYTLNISSHREEEMIDITTMIQNLALESKILNGMIQIFVPHTTAAVTINENTDPHVRQDILLTLKRNFPIEKEHLHFEGNSHAHIKSSVIGNTQSLIIKDGTIKLGPWQAIYFCEFDGPKKRQVNIQIIGKQLCI